MLPRGNVASMLSWNLAIRHNLHEKTYLVGPDKLYCDPWTALFRVCTCYYFLHSYSVPWTCISMYTRIPLIWTLVGQPKLSWSERCPDRIYVLIFLYKSMMQENLRCPNFRVSWRVQNTSSFQVHSLSPHCGLCSLSISYSLAGRMVPVFQVDSSFPVWWLELRMDVL